MKKFISGSELLAQLDMQPFELVNYVKAGHQPFDSNGSPMPPPDITTRLDKLKEMRRNFSPTPPQKKSDSEIREQYKKWGKSQILADLAVIEEHQAIPRREKRAKEIEALEKEIVGLDKSWATYNLPDDDCLAKQIIDMLQKAFFRTDTEDSELIIKQSAVDDPVKNGQKGGAAKKIKEPILQAVVEFLKEKPRRLKESALKVCDAFTKAHNKEDHAVTVKIDHVEHDVFYEAGRIYYKKFLKTKTPNDSIALSTFRNTYISRAKKKIKAIES